MNRRILLLCGLSLVALAVASTDGVLLRRQLKENTSEVYKVQADMKGLVTLPGMGDQDLAMVSTMKLTLKTNKVDAQKNEADVESIITDIQTKAEGMMQMAMDQSGPPPKEIKTSGKMDARNHMVMVAPKSSGMMEMMMSGSGPASSLLFIEFPESAVNVGDSWTFSLPKSPLYGKDIPVLTGKLVGDRDYQGAKVWVVGIEGKVKLDADMSEMLKDAPSNPMAGQKALMKGTVEISGEALVDKTTGQTLVYTTHSKSKSTVEMPDMGMSIDNTGTVKTTMTLQQP